MGSRLVAAALLVALASLGCEESDGPIGSPGGRDGVTLRYLTPRFQVFPTGGEAQVVLALRIQRVGEGAEPEPWSGAVLDVRKERGQGRLSAGRVVTDSEGVARVTLTTEGGPDRTEVRFVVAGDRRQHLTFDVVTAPTRAMDLEPGDVEFVEPGREGLLLQFDLDPSDEIALVPYQLDRERVGIAYRFLHQGAGLDPRAVGLGASPPPVQAHRAPVVSRDRGHVVAGDIESGGLVPSAAVVEAMNIRSCRIHEDRMAPLRYLGSKVALYVDAPADRWQARIDSLGREFDEHVFPTDTELFGPTTDLDGNGLVLVVLTPALEGRGGVYCDNLRNAGVELFHAKWNPEDPIEAPLATLAHELQHVINAGHHRSRGEIGDERWVNEGLSFVAEAASGYWRTPLVRMWQFLNGQNGGLSMLPLEYEDAFADKYQMFFLYVGDRFGRDVYRRLGESGRAGVSNVQHVTGVPFDSLVRDWLVANAVGTVEAAIPGQYRYRSVDLAGMREQIAACECVPKTVFEGMTLEPLRMEGSFDVYRSLDGYDADYWRLVPRESGPAAHELYFGAFGRTSTRLAVVRLR